MKTKSNKIKFHKLHVAIETPCSMVELENIMHAIGDEGHWESAEVSINGNDIIVTYNAEKDRVEA